MVMPRRTTITAIPIRVRAKVDIRGAACMRMSLPASRTVTRIKPKKECFSCSTVILNGQS